MIRRLWDHPAAVVALRVSSLGLLAVNLVPVAIAFSGRYAFADANLDEVAYWIGIALLPVSVVLLLVVLRGRLRLVAVGAWLAILGLAVSCEVPPTFGFIPMPAIMQPLDRIKVGTFEIAAYRRNSSAFSPYSIQIRQEAPVFPGIIKMRILYRTVATSVTVAQVGEMQVRCTFENPPDANKEIILTLVPSL